MAADRNGAAGPPMGPLFYSARDQREDYKRGRKDARRHLPLVPRHHTRGIAPGQHLTLPPGNNVEPGPAAAAISLTPFLNELFNRRNQYLATLYKLYLKERSQLIEALREADGHRQMLLVRQTTAQGEVEKLGQPLTPVEETAFTYGEHKAKHPVELVKRRRTREREEKFRTARGELEQISEELTRMAVAAGKAQGALAGKLQETQAAGMEVVAYYEQRRARYLSGLTHTHRRNVELLELLKLTDPGLPDWVTWGPIALGGA
jgi:hypothetical protein